MNTHKDFEAKLETANKRRRKDLVAFDIVCIVVAVFIFMSMASRITESLGRISGIGENAQYFFLMFMYGVMYVMGTCMVMYTLKIFGTPVEQRNKGWKAGEKSVESGGENISENGEIIAERDNTTHLAIRIVSVVLLILSLAVLLAGIFMCVILFVLGESTLRHENAAIYTNILSIITTAASVIMFASGVVLIIESIKARARKPRKCSIPFALSASALYFPLSTRPIFAQMTENGGIRTTIVDINGQYMMINEPTLSNADGITTVIIIVGILVIVANCIFAKKQV
jgi:hypothetical protein